MKKDSRSTHALLVGLFFSIGTPVGFAIMYYSFHMQYSAFDMEKATWAVTQQYIPHFAFGAVIGVASLLCWQGLRHGARWSAVAWLCVTGFLTAAGLVSFASSPNVVTATKTVVYIVLTWIAYRGATNKKSEQGGAVNPHAFGTFVTHPADAGSAPKASGDT